MKAKSRKLFMKQFEEMLREVLFEAFENMFVKLKKRRLDKLKISSVFRGKF